MHFLTTELDWVKKAKQGKPVGEVSLQNAANFFLFSHQFAQHEVKAAALPSPNLNDASTTLTRENIDDATQRNREALFADSVDNKSCVGDLLCKRLEFRRRRINAR